MTIKIRHEKKNLQNTYPMKGLHLLQKHRLKNAKTKHPITKMNKTHEEESQ